MSTQEHYSLRWNNHQNHILRAFDALLQTKTLVDVTLVCAETSIRAHKVVLSACSPFFQRVFAETPCKHPVIVLKDFKGWVVQAIVDFMYRGEISVPQERLQTLIQAGESLQVRGLVDHPVAGNTPTPAASPDEFAMMDTSIVSPVSPESPTLSNQFENSESIMTQNPKLLFPPHVFVDGSENFPNSDMCSSPMPRRKQARPRRRSGECAPQDLSSKPPTPVPSQMGNSNNNNCSSNISNDDNRHDNCEKQLSLATDEPRQSPSLSIPSSVRNTNKLTMENSIEGPENLCTKNSQGESSDSISNNNNNSNNNNRIVLSLKDIRNLNRPTTMNRFPPPHHLPSHQMSRSHSPSPHHHHHHHHQLNINCHSLSHQSNSLMKLESDENRLEMDSPLMEQMDLSLSQHNMSMDRSQGMDRDDRHRGNKEYTPSSPMSLPSHFSLPEGPPHPPSPLPFPSMPSVSALALTPPHMFGLDTPLGLFPHGMDPSKLYSPLMEMSDPRGMHPDPPPFLKKKMNRPKGQHSAPRGGPPRSWTNAELTEALQHVWNKKMTTSQASRIFGIPYNSLLMYVRGKYGKSLKLEQLRKDCISGPPIELLTMGMSGNNNNSKGVNQNSSKEGKDFDGGPMPRSSSSEPDMLSSPNPLFNPFPPGFYPDFTSGFPGLPLSMLNLLPPERQPPPMPLNIDEDCKSDRSKQSLEDDFQQPLALNRDDRREIINGQD